MKRFQNLLLVLSLLLASSCAHRAHKWVKREIIPNTSSYTIAVNKKRAKESIKVLYTGCGGLVIFKDHEAIMTDPYFTGHPVLTLLGKKIDTTRDSSVIERINQIGAAKDIKTVMISHAHYDHLEDLPYLLDRKKLADTVTIIGDKSTQCTVSPFTNTIQKPILSETISYNQKPKPAVPVKWMQISPHMRVLVIEADHAPHYRGIHLMRGKNCKRPLKKSPLEKSSAFRWHEGRTFSYILDVMDDTGKKPELRIFIQSSSCKPPYGFPPKEVLDEKPVDVAFLGVASSDWVKPYPKEILEHLRPEKIVLIHWEDFFRNFYKKKQKTVRLTHMKRFMRELRKQYKCHKTKELKAWFSMPKPLTEIKIDY